MNSTTISDEIKLLYQRSEHTRVIELAMSHGINPGNDPLSSNILAASYFMVGKHQEAHLLLESLHAAFENNPDFLSLYAANCRRLGNFQLAKELFLTSLNLSPSNYFIKNNYANLLIDTGDLQQAISVLKEITDNHPDYLEAKENLDRAFSLLKINSDTQSAAVSSVSNLGLEDPLLLAFNREEIEFSNQRYINRFKKTPLDPILNSSQAPRPDDVVQDEFTAIELALSEGNSDFALKLCSSIKRKLPLHPRVYELASDAYLSKKLFYESECSLLQSLMLGGKSLKHYFNLATFARIRKDYHLSIHYAELALAIDSSSDHAKSLITSLRQKVKTDNFVFQKPWNLADTLTTAASSNE